MRSRPIFYLRIGVTGHRSLEDPVTVAKHVRQALNLCIKETFNNHPEDSFLHKSGFKTSVSLCALTALAEGADRIVAKEVIKIRGSKIKAVLPLSKEDYLNDFTSDNSIREFKELLKQDRAPKILRLCPIQEQLNEKRVEAYLEAGEYIVDHCDILIAVWDGRVAGGPGGTADVVEYARKRGRSLIIIPVNDHVFPDNSLIIEKGNLGI